MVTMIFHQSLAINILEGQVLNTEWTLRAPWIWWSQPIPASSQTNMPLSYKLDVVIHSELPRASRIVPPEALFPQKCSIQCHLNFVQTKVLWCRPYLTSHCNLQIVHHGPDNDCVLFNFIRWRPAKKETNSSINPSFTARFFFGIACRSMPALLRQFWHNCVCMLGLIALFVLCVWYSTVGLGQVQLQREVSYVLGTWQASFADWYSTITWPLVML